MAAALGVLAVATACTAAAPAEPATTVLVVADATATAAGDQSWPQQLESRSESESESESVEVEVDAVDGSSWLTASPGGVVDRVADSAADITVIALPVEPADVPDELVQAAVRGGIGAAAASGSRVIILGPPGGAAWMSALAETARSAGATFVDLSPVSGSVSDVTTQQQIADAVSAVLG